MTRWPAPRTSTLAFAAVFAATWVAPPWPLEQALHTSLTVVGLALLWRWGPALALTRRDHALLMLFLAVHSVAARWLYSNVPYDEAWRALFGVSLDQALGWQRNQFDRFVHLLYGLCLTPGVCSALARPTHPARPGALSGLAACPPHLRATAAVAVIVISSVCYEWLEWGVAVLLSPQTAEAYNGQQGDAWDAHKDMLLATLGALAWWPALARLRGSTAGPTA